jgi:hypothetical protein
MTAPVPGQNPGPAHPAWLGMREDRIAKRRPTISRLLGVNPAVVAEALQALADDPAVTAQLAAFRAELDDDLTVTAWLAPDPDDTPDGTHLEEK